MRYHYCCCCYWNQCCGQIRQQTRYFRRCGSSNGVGTPYKEERSSSKPSRDHHYYSCFVDYYLLSVLHHPSPTNSELKQARRTRLSRPSLRDGPARRGCSAPDAAPASRDCSATSSTSTTHPASCSASRARCSPSSPPLATPSPSLLSRRSGCERTARCLCLDPSRRRRR